MKKLYCVEIDTHYYVMAESEFEAERIRHDINQHDVFAREATNVGIYREWRDAIPIGSDDDKTCGQIMEEQKEA